MVKDIRTFVLEKVQEMGLGEVDDQHCQMADDDRKVIVPLFGPGDDTVTLAIPDGMVVECVLNSSLFQSEEIPVHNVLGTPVEIQEFRVAFEQLCSLSQKVSSMVS